MDIISHGLYGGVAFGRKSRISYLKAFLFGIAPDLLSFGIFTVVTVLGFAASPDWRDGPPDPSAIPQYVHQLYDMTHSLVVALGAFGLVWFFLTKPVYEMLAWPLHILVDMPTHSHAFFPTPFLWPLSDFTIDGIPWSNPYIFIPNVILISGLYMWWYLARRKRLQKQ